jgi:hypothetical protein
MQPFQAQHQPHPHQQQQMQQQQQQVSLVTLFSVLPYMREVCNF